MHSMHFIFQSGVTPTRKKYYFQTIDTVEGDGEFIKFFLRKSISYEKIFLGIIRHREIVQNYQICRHPDENVFSFSVYLNQIYRTMYRIGTKFFQIGRIPISVSIHKN